MVSIVFLPQLYILLPEMTREWLEVGLDATIKLFTSGEKTSAYSAILDQNFIFPDNIFFGEGGDPLDMVNIGIESGYIQCLWRFGIIGTILLLGAFCVIFVRLFIHSTSSFSKAITVSYAAIFFVYLLKLFSLYNTGATILLIGIPSCVVYCENHGRLKGDCNV